MSLYTRLVSGVLFPLHERLKRHDSVALARELEAFQWLSPAEVARLRAERLRAFLVDIGEHVPYYRELFEARGFDPQQADGVEALAALPLMDKKTIREHVDALTAEDAGPLVRSNTGGSSGEPLVFYTGRGRVSHDVASKWRATRWWDVDIGDPEIVVWGSPIELGSQDRVRQVRDALFRTQLLSAFEMSADNLKRFVETIVRTRPAMLFGYPSAISTIADYAAGQGIPLDTLGVRVVFVTSERLYDYQREKIESAFACPVANGYGGRDAGFIAHQCPEGGMHITAEDIVVEIVDEQGQCVPQGETGEIVVTQLSTRDFPFVRYRTGDVGSLSDEVCPCGRGLPLLKSLDGRATDFMVARDGTVIHGLAFIYVLRDITGVSQFKITQYDRENVTVEIVRNEEYRDSNDAEILEVFTRRLGEGVAIDIVHVPSIAAEKSGKYRYIISHVQPGVGDTATAVRPS